MDGETRTDNHAQLAGVRHFGHQAQLESGRQGQIVATQILGHNRYCFYSPQHKTALSSEEAASATKVR